MEDKILYVSHAPNDNFIITVKWHDKGEKEYTIKFNELPLSNIDGRFKHDDAEYDYIYHLQKDGRLSFWYIDSNTHKASIATANLWELVEEKETEYY